MGILGRDRGEGVEAILLKSRHNRREGGHVF